MNWQLVSVRRPRGTDDSTAWQHVLDTCCHTHAHTHSRPLAAGIGSQQHCRAGSTLCVCLRHLHPCLHTHLPMAVVHTQASHERPQLKLFMGGEQTSNKFKSHMHHATLKILSKLPRGLQVQLATHATPKHPGTWRKAQVIMTRPLT